MQYSPPSKIFRRKNVISCFPNNAHHEPANAVWKKIHKWMPGDPYIQDLPICMHTWQHLLEGFPEILRDDSQGCSAMVCIGFTQEAATAARFDGVRLMQAKRQNSKRSVIEIAQVLGEHWRELSGMDKVPYRYFKLAAAGKVRAADEKAAYVKKMATQASGVKDAPSAPVTCTE